MQIQSRHLLGVRQTHPHAIAEFELGSTQDRIFSPVHNLPRYWVVFQNPGGCVIFRQGLYSTSCLLLLHGVNYFLQLVCADRSEASTQEDERRMLMQTR